MVVHKHLPLPTMDIFHSIATFKNSKKPVLTLGMFDGVHIGHQGIIKNLNQIAGEIGGESTLLTFEPHPRVVLGKEVDDLQLLTTLEEKIELLENAGLKNLIIHPFTKDFSRLDATEFVSKKLCNEIGIHTLVVGYDHHFGKNRSGNFQQLQTLSERLGFHLIQVEEVKNDGLHISSTQIRNALWAGNPKFAKKGLGRHYSLSGKVVHGDKLGRTLGFPTANLELPLYKLIPKDGVYFVKVYLKNQSYKGLLSIGTRPTVTKSDEKRAEVFILDFDQEIYGETLKLDLIEFIRDDQKFDSLAGLIAQMNQDKLFAESYSI